MLRAICTICTVALVTASSACTSEHPSQDSTAPGHVHDDHAHAHDNAPAPDLDKDMWGALCLPKTHADTDAGQAMKKLHDLIVKNGTTADGLVALGKAWARQARQTQNPDLYLNADACGALALDLSPAHPEATNLRLLAMLNDHRFAEAKALAQDLLKAHPDNQMAYGLLSDALYELGELDEAIAMTQRMVDLKPNLPSYARASFLAWLQGDVTSAKVIARQAVSAGQEQKMTEPLSFVITQTADMFWHEGDLKGADAGYDLALSKTPHYAKALLGKARVAHAEGRHKDAVAWARQSFERNRLAETAWLLGDAYAALGQTERAARAYADLEKIGRHHDHRTLGLYLATTGQDAERAVKLVEREMKTRPGLYTKDAYALALSRAGRHHEAVAQAEQVLAIGAPDPQLSLHAGLVLVAAGKTAEGRALLDASVAQNPAIAARFAPGVAKL